MQIEPSGVKYIDSDAQHLGWETEVVAQIRDEERRLCKRTIFYAHLTAKGLGDFPLFWERIGVRNPVARSELTKRQLTMDAFLYNDNLCFR